ncbi:MAG: proline--tRNA ligase [Spirochaetales bacterium]|nr:proline--tRNA ligase [Spirochaetales bacterium]
MLLSRLFSRTIRKSGDPGESASADLLMRGGFIRQLASGVYSYLPLAVNVIRRIESVVRVEMANLGAQEVIMPVVNPADIWKESARWYQIDAEMARFQDRSGRDMVLAMTHEEVAAILARSEILSYRQLPCIIFHIQTKWRDDPRPRAGLLRVREFTMKDSYSLDLDAEGMERSYAAHLEAYKRIFSACGLPVTVVTSDLGLMGGLKADEFMYLNDIGEDTLIICSNCGYAANRQVAAFDKRSNQEETPLPLEKVHTPGVKTIDALADNLKLPKEKLAKAVFLMATAEEKFILALVRGDLEVNEAKLAKAARVSAFRPAVEEEITSRGISPGYGSPIGAKNVTVVMDDSLQTAANFVAGANERDYHFLNVNAGRDFEADIVADISFASAGRRCARCGEKLIEKRGIEVGNIFGLGTKYSESMNCTYLDRDGKRKPVYMGSYGIGIGRLLASVVEQYHDDYGIIWPPRLAPFDIHLVDLVSGREQADHVRGRLERAGYRVLHDDRDERAGVKFNDADLIGIPVRITIGEKTLKEGCVELKLRWEKEKSAIPIEELEKRVCALISGLDDTFRKRFPLESRKDILHSQQRNET